MKRAERLRLDTARHANITGWFARHALVRKLEVDGVVTSARFQRIRTQPPDFFGRWDSAYWFEVVMLQNGRLLVHGDFEMVMFAQHHCSNLNGAVNWLGQSGLGDPYVYEKANMGMHMRMLAHDRVDVAHAALRTARALLFANQCPVLNPLHMEPCCFMAGHPADCVVRTDDRLGTPGQGA